MHKTVVVRIYRRILLLSERKTAKESFTFYVFARHVVSPMYYIYVVRGMWCQTHTHTHTTEPIGE